MRVIDAQTLDTVGVEPLSTQATVLGGFATVKRNLPEPAGGNGTPVYKNSLQFLFFSDCAVFRE